MPVSTLRTPSGNPGPSAGRRWRIAMIGSKGIPAVHGGIERHVEEIASRLAERGHRVEVFTRAYHPYRQPYLGRVRLRRRPSVPTKHLDAATHTLGAVLEACISQRYDIVHVHGIGPGMFLDLVPRRQRTVFTFHAQDWRQRKWGRLARWALQRGERVAMRRADEVIVVSRLLERYVLDTYGRDAHFIPNGAVARQVREREALQRWSLEPLRYVLFVGRIIPDRGIDALVEAYARVPGEHRLVIVGEWQLPDDARQALLARGDRRVQFLGQQPSDVLEQLYAHAAFCVHPSSVEGLPIAVLEAMSHGRAVLVSDIPENLEAIGDAGLTFRVGDVEDLAAKIQTLLTSPETVRQLGRCAGERVRRHFDWDRIARATEEVYARLMG